VVSVYVARTVIVQYEYFIILACLTQKGKGEEASVRSLLQHDIEIW
jgi:hypothetical protein